MENDTRVCSVCRLEKPVTEFNLSHTVTSGRTNRCRPCGKAYMQKWHSENIEREKRYSDAYDKAHPERVQKRLAPLKAREAADPAWYRKILKDWMARHPGYGSHQWKKRESWLNAAGPRHTETEWRALVEECGGKCVSCGSTENIQRDHIVPASKGGTDHISNIQPLCEACNRKKFTRTVNYRLEIQLGMDI